MTSRADRHRRRATLACSLAILYATPIGAGLLRRFELIASPASANATHNVRWAMLQEALRYFLDNPLLGIGLGTSVPFPFGARTAMTDGVDSLFPTVFLKLGVVGGLIVLALFGHAFVQAVRAVATRDEDGSFESRAQGAFLPWLGGFLVLSLFTYPIGNISLALFVGATMGLFLNVARGTETDTR